MAMEEHEGSQDLKLVLAEKLHLIRSPHFPDIEKIPLKEYALKFIRDDGKRTSKHILSRPSCSSAFSVILFLDSFLSPHSFWLKPVFLSAPVTKRVSLRFPRFLHLQLSLFYTCSASFTLYVILFCYYRLLSVSVLKRSI